MDTVREFVVVGRTGLPYGTHTYEDARDKLWRNVTMWGIREHEEAAIKAALEKDGVYRYQSCLPDVSPIASAVFHNHDKLPLRAFINKHLDVWPRSAAYVARALEAWSKREGPRLGDMFLRPTVVPGTYGKRQESRFTYHWGDEIQPGGGSGGFFMYDTGGVSYSGGLDPSVKLEHIKLVEPQEERYGEFWFFKDGCAGAHRGIEFNLPIRTYIEVV